MEAAECEVCTPAQSERSEWRYRQSAQREGLLHRSNRSSDSARLRASPRQNEVDVRPSEWEHGRVDQPISRENRPCSGQRSDLAPLLVDGNGECTIGGVEDAQGWAGADMRSAKKRGHEHDDQDSLPR